MNRPLLDLPASPQVKTLLSFPLASWGGKPVPKNLQEGRKEALFSSIKGSLLPD